MNKLLLSVAEVSEVLGLSRPTIYKLVYSDRIPSLKLGAKIMIPRIALEEMIADVCKH